MILNKEYFLNPYYFYLSEVKDNINLYFSVSESLTESRKKDELVSFNKKNKKEIEKTIDKITKEKKIKSTSELKKHLEDKKNELDEIVDSDGTFLNSKVPILNPKLAPKGTTDQEIVQNRQPGNPIWRTMFGRYWGESENKNGNLVSEIDLSGTFGREETEDLSGPETFKVYRDVLGMDTEEAKERTKQQGKTPDPKQHKKRLKLVPKRIKNDPNFIDRITLVEKEKIEEERKQKVLKMVEDMVVGKKNSDKDISKSSSTISNLLKKNLESIKKVAEKEGLSIDELIKILKRK
jgi:hypothetical protein